MIKIGIDCEPIENDTWGVARIISKLLENIAQNPELQKEYRFYLYFKSKIPNYPYLDNPIFVKQIVSVPFIPQSWGRASFSLYFYVALPIKLWFEGLDLFCSFNYMLPIIHLGKSIVMLTEDVYYEMTQGKLPFRYRLAYTIFSTWASWRADKILAISETSKKEVSRLFGISPERIVVNHLGVDITSGGDSNFELGDQKYLLYVGQAFPRRHLKEALAAFEKISPRFPDLKFVVIGIDKYNPAILEDFKNRLSERLIHKEYVSDQELSQYYSHAQALLYVSDREAFGLPPMEALIRGSVPIIAANDLGQELFGDNAFYVYNPNSIESTAEAIDQVLTNTDTRGKINSHAPEIAQKFSWQAHTERFLQICKNITK
jgi:glycosyltransferase involved in cell wall biosynthesis